MKLKDLLAKKKLIISFTEGRKLVYHGKVKINNVVTNDFETEITAKDVVEVTRFNHFVFKVMGE